MDFEWDDQKRLSNIEQHGIDFVVARHPFDGRARRDFTSPRAGEHRFLSVGELNGMMVAVAWTWPAPRSGSFLPGERAVKKNKNIVRYTDKELAAMEARGEDRTDWNAVRAKTEEQLAADMASDPGRGWQGRMNAVLRSFVERRGGHRR